MELLKEARARFSPFEYYVKLHYDETTNKYTVYANNTNFNWGHVAVFESLEEAESDFENTIKNNNNLRWVIK